MGVEYLRKNGMENELTEKMIKDISKYWDIVKLVKLKKAGDARCLDQRKPGDI